MLNEAQRAAHYGGIGGSKVATVLGLDPYQSPLDFYHGIVRFQDEGPPPEQPPSEAAVWGLLLENAIAKEWARRREVAVSRVNVPRRDKVHPFLVANPDRLVRGSKWGLEVKNRTAFKLSAYDAGPLESEVLQCHHYMRIWQAPLWSLAVLVGGQKLLDFDVAFDAELSELATTACVQFWHEHVLPRRPPPPTRLEDLESYYARGRLGATVTASPEVREALLKLADVKADLARLRKEADAHELVVKAAMLEATELLDESGATLVTWRNAKDSSKVDWQGLVENIRAKGLLPADVLDGYVSEYTVEAPGSRRFLMKKGLSNG